MFAWLLNYSLYKFLQTKGFMVIMLFTVYSADTRGQTIELCEQFWAACT